MDETLILAARVGLSLAAVLALLWWLSRRMQRSTAMRRRRKDAVVLLGRQQLGGKSGVALVESGGRRLVLGYGEQGVTLLHDAGDVPAEDEPGTARSDLDLELLELADDGDTPALDSTPREPSRMSQSQVTARTADARRPRTPLEGSILAPTTWRQAVVAAQEWTTRRS